ncbi:unnamed protein product [Sphenostylis stenocarpa]|uniref:Uncharacterized protein n=1 Tax=Sphenostylis stenocarpa TaxID=92480 RepID=A0AA86VBJ4_9FABA|nr:unnamed protein product [Sphenostylis stenocarpa]
MKYFRGGLSHILPALHGIQQIEEEDDEIMRVTIMMTAMIKKGKSMTNVPSSPLMRGQNCCIAWLPSLLFIHLIASSSLLHSLIPFLCFRSVQSCMPGATHYGPRLKTQMGSSLML